MIKLKKYYRGMSLIEVLVALGLSLVIMAGAITLLMGNKRVYKEQNEMGRLQENARFAVELLIKDIRMAGYVGCVDNIEYVNNDVNGSSGADDILNVGNAVEGSESAANWQPSNSTEIVGSIVAGTDAITIKYLAPSGIFLTQLMPTTSSVNFVSASTSFAENEILAVSDCESADVFQVTQVITGANPALQHNPGGSNNPGNDTGDMSKKYGTEAQILRMVSRRYYIGTGANGESSLFRYGFFITAGVGAEVSQELIPGIDNMQLLYGEDTSNDAVADTFVNAATVSNWDNVVSVRLSLLVNSEDENFSGSEDTATYNLLGTNVGPYNDFRRRKLFTNTIQVRNRSN